MRTDCLTTAPATKTVPPAELDPLDCDHELCLDLEDAYDLRDYLAKLQKQLDVMDLYARKAWALCGRKDTP